MITLFVLFIIGCSTFFWQGHELRIAQEAFYQLAGMTLVLSSFFYNLKPIRRSPINMWMGIFGIYAIFLFLLGGANIGAQYMFNIVIGVLLFFKTQQLEKRHTKIILHTILWVCILNVLWMVLQELRLDPIFSIKDTARDTLNYEAKDLIGFLGLKAVMGMWMGLGLLACLFISPWIAVLFAYPIYLSQCSSVVMGLAITVPFYFFFTKRLAFKILLPLLLIVGSLYVVFIDSPMGMMKNRPIAWRMFVRDTVYGTGSGSRFLKNSFTGFGLDSFRMGAIKYFKESKSDKTIRAIVQGNKMVDEQGRNFYMAPNHVGTQRIHSPDGKLLDHWDNPHNIFVHVFFEMGLIALVIIGFILFHLFKRFRYAIKDKQLVIVFSMILFFLLTGVSQFPTHLARIGCVFPILLGLLVVNTEGD